MSCFISASVCVRATIPGCQNNMFGLMSVIDVIVKAGLHVHFYLPAPCLPSTADKNGDAFTRQTCDLNKYSCVELSCVGGEFRVQRQYVSLRLLIRNLTVPIGCNC